ncbi:DUF503 domain-containing protein [candidate division KSB1 bacterium]|nr:DUF503 domain-containing protein [bacterium]OQX59817.1 MAG: hypothetical protein B5M50_02080 [candidate division KSB1 bacterium 4484_219]RKY80647.1 MAG: DUF503 domain-containing protein [candidate division KSB1 bacterium]HDI52354.1 DUF503 domain-containing protein [Bacteroidota bacterium]RKY81093.1 MAG: DUF503 domain-containing protein [candidate division KSB1 bacterium]
MMVAVCQIELYIPGCTSLKEKRFALKSVKTRIRNKFNVSVSEIDKNDKWQRATLGIAFICNDRKIIDSAFTQILTLIEGDVRLEVIDHIVDIY